MGRRVGGALDNDETRIIIRQRAHGQRFCLHLLDVTQRRRGFDQFALKACERRCVAFGFNEDAAAVIADETRYAATLGTGINVRAKAYALHDAAHLNAQPLHGVYCCFGQFGHGRMAV